MKPTTLCFPVTNDGNILLGRKKRGFGIHKYNGFGGKIDQGETFRQCAVRELFEEVSLLAKPENLRLVGFLDFRFPYEPELTHIGYIYTVDTFEGIPLESEEMDPQWFTWDTLPFEQMWEGDKFWLPQIAKGELIEGFISFGPDNNTVEEKDIRVVNRLVEVELV